MIFGHECSFSAIIPEVETKTYLPSTFDTEFLIRNIISVQRFPYQEERLQPSFTGSTHWWLSAWWQKYCHKTTQTHREKFLRITHHVANRVRNAATITHIAKPPLPAFKVSQDGKMPTWIRRLGVFWFRRASYQPSLHWNCLQKDQLLQRTLFSRRQLTNCFIPQGLTRKYHWSVKILQPQ